MKKYLVLLFGLCLFVFVPQIHAQPQMNTGLRFVCLDAQWCKDAACPSGKQHVHRTALSSTTTKAVTSSKTYVTECVDVDGEVICTTGNRALDIELFGPADVTGMSEAEKDQWDHLKLLQSKAGYSLNLEPSYGIYHFDPATNQYVQKDLNNPQGLVVQSDGQGNIIPMEWQSYTQILRMRKFMMWNKIQGSNNIPLEGEGQKQADLRFIFRSSSCAGNAYDPYGKVFDMNTLEPIPGVDVTLKQYDIATNNEVEITIANPNVRPYKTSSTGQFSFLVVDGNYALVPIQSEYVHAMTTDAALLPINTSRIYSDLYYADSPVIRQRGVIQHRDIVMKAKNGTGNTFPLKILDQNTQESNGKLIYEGFISHPFALLNVEVCTPTAGGCVQSKEFNHRNGGPDKNGKFKITLDQSTLLNGQNYKMKFVKQDLTTATLTQTRPSIDGAVAWVQSMVQKLVGIVHAQETTAVERVVNPIPLYLEGYAYDNEGNIMPNATVGVYVSFSEAPIYSMTADNNGYFRITSEFIPATEYSLRFTSNAEKENVSYQSTSQFLANNNEFIEAEKIKPYKFASSTTNPRRNVTPSFVPQQKISPLVTEVSPTAAMAPSGTQKEATTTTTARNPMYLIGAVLLILLGGAGVMLAIYVYKKRSPEDESTSAQQ